jgi:hypothetical protein
MLTDKVKKRFDTEGGSQVKKVNIKTSKGYELKGYTSLKPNKQMGSIYIETIDDIKADTFIHGMPRLNYWDTYNNYLLDSNITIRAKEDGTNISICAVPREDKFIDIIYKTRKVPNIAHKWQVKLDNFDLSKAEEYLMKNGGTLCFELFGQENHHHIQYNTKLDLRLLAVFDKNEKLLNQKRTGKVALQIEIPQPDELFKLHIEKDGYILKPTKFFTKTFGRYTNNEILNKLDKKSFVLENLYDNLEEVMEEVNQKAIRHGVGYVIEGVIWTGVSAQTKKIIQIKCKSTKIREKHKTASGIPIRFITTALYKFKEEHEDCNKIYKNDHEQIINDVNRELLEDWSKEIVEAEVTQNKVYQKMIQVFAEKEIDEHLKEVAQKLIDENPETEEFSDLMRIFSQQYPQLRKQSRAMFSAIKSLKDE